VRCLSLPSRTSPATAPDRLCALIESVGTPAFTEELFLSVTSMLEASDAAVYAYGTDRRTRVVAAWGRGAGPLEWRTRAYAQRFADHDPALQTPTADEVITTCIDTAELTDPGHRALLEETGFASRVVSVFPAPGGGWYSLNVPRPAGHAVPERVLDARLAALCPELTPREIGVCQALLRGETTAEVAVALGIRASSVQTYRKRAYAKLRVSNLAGLFQRLL
jgi:DNA-binding CsgD family transcriptional regulator